MPSPLRPVALIALTALAACEPAPSHLDPTSPFPPPVMTMDAPAAYLSDAPNVITIHGVPAGRNAHLVASFATSGDFFCPAPTAPFCFNLYDPATYLGRATATLPGTATWTVSMPPGVTAATGTLQAVAMLSGGRLAFTEAAERPVITSNGDEDGDGISNADELAAGSDPFAGCMADADGDGVCDPFDQCEGDDATGDTDRDNVCDDLDMCDGDDATGNTDHDGVCDDIDLCVGNDTTGDPDGDGVCGDLEHCLTLGSMVLPDATCLGAEQASADTFVCSDDWASNNYGTSHFTSRAVGQQNGSTGNQVGRALFSFPIPPTGPQSVVTQATVVLTSWDNFAGYPMEVALQEITGLWTENGVTWDTQPTVNPVVLDTATVACCHQEYRFDVTQAVRTAIQNGQTTVAVRLASTDEAAVGGIRWFFRESDGISYGSGAGIAPKIEVITALP